ncbi:hypothetical protein O3G_MSEX001034 [Manduca sexta]|nr:hypothetical protein O3G_MSEX001034 [Manduca sexta]
MKATKYITNHQNYQLYPLKYFKTSLQPDDWSVRCGAAGVLVNVCGAGANVSRGAALAAAALTGAAAARDHHLAALLTRALWNAHAHTALAPQTAHQAAVALAAFIGKYST